MANRKLSETIPVAPLKVIATPSTLELATEVNEYLIQYRHDKKSTFMQNAFDVYGYKQDSYLADAVVSRFGSGEAKAVMKEQVCGCDVFIVADVMNHEHFYSINDISYNYHSPDDNFQDLKRIIAAVSICKPHRINLVMPFLYESRQHKRDKLESLDCASALQELATMGVENFITFDAHDPRVQNAIPIRGFDNFFTSLQFIRELVNIEKENIATKDNLMVISPDEGGMGRAVYYANVLGVELGMFYKRRDYSTIVNGKNPIVAHEFLGSDVKGKSLFIVDDMISSGESVLDVAKELKKRGAEHIYIAATFGLFCDGFKRFDEYYANGYFDRIFVTNLTRMPEEAPKKPYFTSVNLSKYIALIIDTINHDTSVNDIIDANLEIKKLVDSIRED